MSVKWKIAQAAEVKWWINYLKNRDKTEYYDWKRTYWTQFLKDIEFDLPTEPSTILDAGCGPAGIFTILEEHNAVAIDPLLDKYLEALPQFDQTDFPYTNFITSPLERMPQLGLFDIIFCLNAINHVNSIPSSLTNMFNALKPGGKLILSTDAHNSNFLKGVFQMVPGDILHPHQYNLNEYLTHVNNAGFQIKFTKKMKSEKIFSYWVIQAYRPH